MDLQNRKSVYEYECRICRPMVLNMAAYSTKCKREYVEGLNYACRSPPMALHMYTCLNITA